MLQTELDLKIINGVHSPESFFMLQPRPSGNVIVKLDIDGQGTLHTLTVSRADLLAMVQAEFTITELVGLPETDTLAARIAREVAEGRIRTVEDPAARDARILASVRTEKVLHPCYCDSAYHPNGC